MKGSGMLHFTRVFNVCKSTCIVVFSTQRVFFPHIFLICLNLVLYDIVSILKTELMGKMSLVKALKHILIGVSYTSQKL